jgi:Na+/H+ antiporter NhaD/arsenite permease-like protein
MELSFAPAMAVGTFAAVIVAIASNRLHLTVAALLGVVALLVTGVQLLQSAPLYARSYPARPSSFW